MKGGLVCLLYALEALKATGNPAFDTMSMTVIFNSDEEVLSPTSTPLIQAEARQARTVCVFEPARPGGEYVIRRKGVGKYLLTVKGRAAHAGAQPENGRSAIEEMARQDPGHPRPDQLRHRHHPQRRPDPRRRAVERGRRGGVRRD